MGQSNKYMVSSLIDMAESRKNYRSFYGFITRFKNNKITLPKWHIYFVENN
jgi:hypothetical protein